MTGLARKIAVASLSLMLAMMFMVGAAAAQTSLFEVENSEGTKLVQVGQDAGFVVKGTLDAGTIPATGEGARLMWYPTKAALRAGWVGGDGWDDQNIGAFSMAFGSNTTASGSYATALGVGTISSGPNSTALGTGSRAVGNFSTALGTRVEASGTYSTAIGLESKAVGSYSTALGFQTSATGSGSTATGVGTTASADYATAMGGSSIASANSSTAMGQATVAGGDYATAMGFQTQASGISSTAMGAASIAAGLASVAMGTRAIANGAGSFVFADRSSTATHTAAENQFMVRAHGGIGLNSGTNIGCDLPAGVGAWACTSSRHAKEGFEDVDGETVLAKLSRIRIQRWHYLGTPSAHVGPTAEDFHGAFGLGEGPTTITTVDADGIALLGVQTLERRTTDLRTELRAEVAALRAELAAVRQEMWAAEERSRMGGGDRAGSRLDSQSD